MKYSTGDFLDRLSILRLKKERHKVDESQLDMFEEEYQKQYAYLDQYVGKLYKVNASIWDLEYDIRMGIEKDLSVIGSKALKIRDINNIRVSLVNEINRVTLSGYQDNRDYVKGL